MYTRKKSKKQVIIFRKKMSKQFIKFHKYLLKTKTYKKILLIKDKSLSFIKIVLTQLRTFISSREKKLDKYIFNKLTPVDNADLSAYEEAFEYALKMKDLKNIAVTGPYGSGKSSIIRTYESQYNLNFLNISLATFNEIDKDEDPDDSLIEKSILQQLVYSQKADTLKYSRFKRITKPFHPYIVPLFTILWVICGYIIYKFDNFILKIPPSNWSIPTELVEIINLVNNQEFIVLLVSSLVFAVITYIIIFKIYQNIHRIRLKKISFKEVEIDTTEVPNESILNKHIDEIIYFFEETDFEVVVFEDLDRFESRYIFTKLREINKLINDYFSQNNKNKTIKFIYGIKDLMFTNTNRVKFFDFIIPIVPIVNSYSAYDVISSKAEELEKLFNLKKNKFDQNFLTDIALYLYDLRLIHNIFNELQIYYEILPKKSTDINKLLAVIIYKNIYSSDFELQYSGKGFLVDLLNKKEDHINNKLKDIEEKIETLQKSINDSKNEVIESEQQLILSYIGYIYTNLLQGHEDSLHINNEYIHVRDLKDITNFNHLVGHIREIETARYNSQRRKTDITFNQISDAIHPGKTFSEIKINVKNKAIEQQNQYRSKLTKLSEQQSYAHTIPLSVTIRENNDILNEIKIDSEETKTDNSDRSLFLYLVTSGYLDENYQVYISNFHEGKLSLTDYEYLQSIRSLQNVTPEQTLNNPKEVCNRMRPEEFSSPAVLNIDLIDFLVNKDRKKDNDNRIDALKYISKHSKNSEIFISKYLELGKHSKKFILQLADIWPQIGIELFSFSFGSNVISLILNNIKVDNVVNKMNDNNKLKSLIEEHANSIFSSKMQVPNDFTILKNLDVKFNSVKDLSGYRDLVEYIYQNNLYKINVENIQFILQHVYKIKDINLITKSNYTTILSLSNKPIAKYVINNIKNYIESVFSLLKNNDNEDEKTIIGLLNNNSIPLGQRENILISQKCLLSDITSIPTELWTFSFVEEKIKTNWENIEKYLNFDEMDEEILDSTLDNSYSEINKNDYKKIDNPPEGWKYIHRHIFNNDKLDNTAYINLLNAMIYYWESFPSVSREKEILLINNHKVVLSEDSFPIDDEALTALLIEKNFSEYKKNEAKYSLNVNYKYHLLGGGLDILDKAKIAKSISLTEINTLPVVGEVAGKILSDYKVDISAMDFDVIKEIIKKTDRENSVIILNKLMPILDKSQVTTILREIPDIIYSNLTILKQKPKFPNKEPHISFLNHLKNKKMISIGEDKKRNKLIAYPKNLI